MSPWMHFFLVFYITLWIAMAGVSLYWIARSYR